MYTYRAVIVRWVDGDTVDCNVDLGFTVFALIRFRLLGVNTPETNRIASREAGKAAQAYAEDKAPAGSRVLVKSRKTGKYGRWLGEVYPLDSNDSPTVSVNDMLLESGHAVAY